MTEEIGKELPEKPTKFVQKVKERAENKLGLADQYPQEAQPNIRANAKHFLDCLRQISPEKQAEIKSTAGLIEALNEVTEKESLFLKHGETFFSPAMRRTLKIIKILPPGPVDLSTEKGFYLSGINFWDYNLSLGSRFIPGSYFFKEVTSPTHTKRLLSQ